MRGEVRGIEQTFVPRSTILLAETLLTNRVEYASELGEPVRVDRGDDAHVLFAGEYEL